METEAQREEYLKEGVKTLDKIMETIKKSDKELIPTTPQDDLSWDIVKKLYLYIPLLRKGMQALTFPLVYALSQGRGKMYNAYILDIINLNKKYVDMEFHAEKEEEEEEEED